MSDTPTYDRLNKRMRAFVRAYVETGVGVKAIRAIGYEGPRADASACRLLVKPKIRVAVDEYERYIVDERVRKRIYANLSRLIQIRDFDPIWLNKSLEDWPEEVRLVIQGIDVEELFTGKGEKRQHIGRVLKYRIASRIDAAKLIGQFQRAFIERHEHTGLGGGPIHHKHVDELTDVELEAIARTGRPAPAEPETGED